jgi:hypothetical protein
VEGEERVHDSVEEADLLGFVSLQMEVVRRTCELALVLLPWASLGAWEEEEGQGSPPCWIELELLMAELVHSRICQHLRLEEEHGTWVPGVLEGEEERLDEVVMAPGLTKMLFPKESIHFGFFALGEGQAEVPFATIQCSADLWRSLLQVVHLVVEAAEPWLAFPRHYLPHFPVPSFARYTS